MTISAVLLAGGKSRRMGRDKATMNFHGAPLWKNQLDLLRAIQPVELFISAQNDPQWRPSDVQFVADEEPSRGPLGGIAAALTHITGTHLFGLAIDMPFMTATYLRRLCGQVQPGQGIVPIIDGRAEPLTAIYPGETQDEFAYALSGNDFSLQPLVRDLIAGGKLRPIEVSGSDVSLFRNLNEPKDI